jgi:cobalt/nickel transport system permease protein
MNTYSLRIITALLALVGILVMPNIWFIYAGLALGFIILITLLRISIAFILKRLVVILPFILIIALFSALGRLSTDVILFTFIKSSLSILTVIILCATTTLPQIIEGLAGLRMPRIIIWLLSFMYRYFEVLVSEAGRMHRAALMRSGRTGPLTLLHTLGHIIGSLFVRSYERAERIYQAMVLRGFENTND